MPVSELLSHSSEGWAQASSQYFRDPLISFLPTHLSFKSNLDKIAMVFNEDLFKVIFQRGYRGTSSYYHCKAVLGEGGAASQRKAQRKDWVHARCLSWATGMGAFAK